MTETKNMVWKGSNNELIQNHLYKVTIEENKIIKAELNGKVIIVTGDNQVINENKWVELTSSIDYKMIEQINSKIYRVCH
jgi:hypothetical protein